MALKRAGDQHARAGKLTARQEAFCREYLVDHNAAAAYRRVGLSSARANVGGSELLRNATVRARIGELEAEAAERNDVSVDWVLQGLKRIAVRGQHDSDRRRALRDIGEHIGMWPKRPPVEEPEATAAPEPLLVMPEPCRSAEEWNAVVPAMLAEARRMREDPEYAASVEAAEKEERAAVMEAARPYASPGATTVVEPADGAGGRTWRVTWSGDQGGGGSPAHCSLHHRAAAKGT